MDTIATLTHVEGTKFDATTASGHSVRIEGGDRTTGGSPMEMLLVALGGCSAVTVVAFLEKMRQRFESFEVEVSGERAEDPPRVYTKIHLGYRVIGDVDEEKVKRAIELTESKYCSVHTMLSKAAEMSHTIELA